MLSGLIFHIYASKAFYVIVQRLIKVVIFSKLKTPEQFILMPLSLTLNIPYAMFRSFYS